MSVKHFEHCWRWDYLNDRGIIEMVPVSWLKEYMLTNPVYDTTDTHGKPVDLKALEAHLLNEGLQHAGVLEVSRKTGATRIIAGTHRLKVCDNLQLSYFPVYVIIIDEFYSPELGEGVVKSNNLNTDLVNNTRGDVVAAPSKVFNDLKGIAFCKQR